MSFDLLMPPPLLTSDLPGIGGRIKHAPEDFEVEEIPAYDPSGQGEFLYLWIEKRDMGAEYFLLQIAWRLEISPGDIGSAGMKDRHAVTRQMISVPASVEDRVKEIEGEGIRILSLHRHSNKLRPGHLRGNRFRILVRDVSHSSPEVLQPLADRIRNLGLPNFYGPQRFGRDGETAQLGFAFLGGSPKRVSPWLRRLALSAAQSALFNTYLSQRLTDGFFRRVLPGDVMNKWPYGGMFVAEDVQAEQLRFDAREIVSTGPMFGRKMFAAAAEASAREADVLRDFGLTAASFAGFGKLLQGTRRKNLIYIDDLEVAVESDGVRLCFSLPAGSYATVLLREFMKNKYFDDDERE